MEIGNLSSKYHTRYLEKEDVEIIYELCSQNDIFYRYHPPFVTQNSILEDMEALPPNKEKKDKFYLGFFEENHLIAIMDLILDYPKEGVAYIGFFMMDKNYQGKGIGTKIISDCAKYLSSLQYTKICLAIDQGNPQSEAFWTKNNFVKTGEETPNGISAYIPMERVL